jgi:hypothetical protein
MEWRKLGHRRHGDQLTSHRHMPENPMSAQKFVATCVMLLLACVSSSAFAFSETLTFRLNAQGQVEAVITGLTGGLGCEGSVGSIFDPPTSVTVTGNSILIVSVPIAHICTIPRNPFTYSQVANLGNLTGIAYQVTWNEGPQTPPFLTLSALLNVSDFFPGATPALSPWMAALLVLSLFGISIAALRRRA